MMMNIGTRVATVNIPFFRARNAASIGRKMLQYTTLYVKFHHCTLRELKTQVQTISEILVRLSVHCADRKQHPNPDFSTKSVNNTLQTCVDIAKEYLQAYNMSAGMKNHLFFSLHQCKSAGYTTFLFAIVRSN